MSIFGVVIEDFQAIIDRCKVEGAGGILIFFLKLLHLWPAMILDLLLFDCMMLGSLAVSGEDNLLLFGRTLLIGHSL